MQDYLTLGLSLSLDRPLSIHNHILTRPHGHTVTYVVPPVHRRSAPFSVLPAFNHTNNIEIDIGVSAKSSACSCPELLANCSHSPPAQLLASPQLNICIQMQNSWRSCRLMSRGDQIPTIREGIYYKFPIYRLGKSQDLA